MFLAWCFLGDYVLLEDRAENVTQFWIPRSQVPAHSFIQCLVCVQQYLDCKGTGTCTSPGLKSVGTFDTINRKQRGNLNQVGGPCIFSFIQGPHHHDLQRALSMTFPPSFLAMFLKHWQKIKKFLDSMKIRRKSFAWLINWTGTFWASAVYGMSGPGPGGNLESMKPSSCLPEAHSLAGVQTVASITMVEDSWVHRLKGNTSCWWWHWTASWRRYNSSWALKFE